MKVETLEDLGFVFNSKLSDENYFVYDREDESIGIDFDKRKISYSCDEDINFISFAIMQAIINLVKENAIY